MSAYPWWPDSSTGKLLQEFILKFSRLEYSLKRQTEFSKSQPYFQADWDAYKNAVAQQPLPSALQEALDYLKASPPQKQIGSNKWEASSDYSSDWDLLIKSLKTVRNNLFHGGKNPWESVRDATLIRHCIQILDSIVSLSPEPIPQVYTGEAPSVCSG